MRAVIVVGLMLVSGVVLAAETKLPISVGDEKFEKIRHIVAVKLDVTVKTDIVKSFVDVKARCKDGSKIRSSVAGWFDLEDVSEGDTVAQTVFFDDLGLDAQPQWCEFSYVYTQVGSPTVRKVKIATTCWKKATNKFEPGKCN